MGFVDKLKNALFEEVEEEIEEKEEKPKKEKVRKNSVKDKLIKREKEKKDNDKKEKEEKPIAKKVLLEDTLDERVDYHELRDEDFEIEPLTEEKEEESIPKFTVIDDSDLIVDDYQEEKPLISDTVRDVKEEKEEFSYYDNSSKPYGIDRDNNIKMHEYGAISRKEEKSIFRPSPIISPIYGILDKNYKKEDIVNKRDTHITSSYERKNMSIEDVRKKAYGTISDDLMDDMDKEIGKEEDVKEVLLNDDNLLVDLSDDNKKPEVDSITMGDAEEYFEDLGLEYNVDYVDKDKESDKKQKREKDHYEEVEEQVPNIQEIEDKEENDKVDDDDDNLFDLIDSMYQEKE